MANYPISNLRDNFEDNVVGALWVNGYVPTGSATRAETGGQAIFTLPAATAGTHNAGYQTSATYDLTADGVTINVGTMVSTAVAATAALTVFDANDPSSWVRFAQLSGNLNFQKSLAGVTTSIGTAVAWSAATHKYWRIREAASTIYLDTSSNSTTWTNRGSVTTALSFVPTAVLVRIDATCGNVASPGSFRIDELNATYPALTTNWHWTQVEWPLQNRFLNITIAATSGQGYIATADSTDAAGNLLTPRYYSGPIGSSSGGYNSLTLQTTQALAQAAAITMPTDGRWDLPSLDECRFIRLYHRSTTGSSYTVREYYPRRLVQSDDIEAESIRAINIAAGAITADKIFVLTLGAITANIGKLNIDTTGYLYQGTGTGDAPTTGLKIFNSGGIGKLSTYNAGVEQVTFDTDGKLKWAAGAGVLDASGLSLIAPAALAPTNEVVWKTASRTVAFIGALDTSPINIFRLEAIGDASNRGILQLIASPKGAFNGSGITISAAESAIIPGTITMSADKIIPDHLNVGSASGAAAGQISTSGSVGVGDAVNSVTRLRVKGASATSSDYSVVVVNSAGTVALAIRNDNRIGFFGATEVARPTVTGSRGANAALASALTALANLGLVTDSSVV